MKKLIVRVFLDPVFPAEALDPSGSVDNLLFAGIERVACGADFHVHIALGGAGLYRVPADTGDGRLIVRRMNAFFHELTPSGEFS